MYTDIFYTVKTNKKILAVSFMIFIIGVLIFRPIYVKSECSEIAYLRAKSRDTDLYDKYVSLVSLPTYFGFNDFLKDNLRNKNPDLTSATYTNTNYNFEYSRCLHEHGE